MAATAMGRLRLLPAPVLVLFCGLIFILGPSIILAQDDLQCWICDSLIDPLCRDDQWTGVENANIHKQNCSRVKVQIGVDRVSPRIQLATTCSKFVVTDIPSGEHNHTMRTCASQGDPGIVNATVALCTVNYVGTRRTEICLCRGDNCNSSGRLKGLTVDLTSALGFGVLLAVVYA